MPEVRLIPIAPDGAPGEPVSIPALAAEVMTATAAMYGVSGFEPPWIGYLASCDGRIVGTCAFKGAPVDGRVEIAYFTFPEFEGRGFATAMATRLVTIAAAESPPVRLTAQTLPLRNASNAILVKLGFSFAGPAMDDEAGEVWEWHLA